MISKSDLTESEKTLNKKLQGDSENWNLTLGLIVILENVAKMKEWGRVLPWSSFKNAIYQVYSEYNLYLAELQQYPNSNVNFQVTSLFLWMSI